MAENLVGFVNPGQPYLHSTPRNFRWQVHNRISGSMISGKAPEAEDLKLVCDQLEAIANQLRREAETFLAPWNNDYKKASQELFGTTRTVTGNPYATRLKAILNSAQFVEIVRTQYNYVIDEKELSLLFEENNIRLTKKIIESNPNTEERLAAYGKSIVKKIVDESKKGGHTGKRVYLGGLENVISFALGEIKQSYFRDSSTLEKRIQQTLKRRYRVINWTKVFDELSAIFLSYFPNDENAKNFIQSFKPLFFAQTRKAKAADKSNISSFVSENLQASIINTEQLDITVYDLGDLNEDKIMEFVANLNLSVNNISKMDYRGNSATQSGSDWILVNSNGMAVRAQVKNSLPLAEEFEKEAKINSPAQTIKIQEGIKYLTLQENMKKYSRGEGLTEEDWAFLDYLIANILWMRAGKNVTQDKGDNYKSGVSGIQELIDRLLAKEVGYFLGVTLELGNSSIQAVNAVIGASNVFFVIDNLVLYPTYLLIENIIKQLKSVQDTLAKLHITLGENYEAKIKPDELKEKKQKIQNQIPWTRGTPYSTEMLNLGREYGKNIIESLTISRVNMNININQILHEVYSTVLK